MTHSFSHAAAQACRAVERGGQPLTAWGSLRDMVVKLAGIQGSATWTPAAAAA
jgi:hypothetical protein